MLILSKVQQGDIGLEVLPKKLTVQTEAGKEKKDAFMF